MFRVLLLGVNYQLSDRQLQFQLLDRRSFKRFVGLRNECTVPDRKTIWKCRHRLAACRVARRNCSKRLRRSCGRPGMR